MYFQNWHGYLLFRKYSEEQTWRKLWKLLDMRRSRVVNIKSSLKHTDWKEECQTLPNVLKIYEIGCIQGVRKSYLRENFDELRVWKRNLNASEKKHLNEKHCSLWVLKMKYPVKHFGGFLTMLKHLNMWKWMSSLG